MTDASRLGVLDELPSDAFAAALAPLFEGAPGFLRRLAAERPLGTWPALFDTARGIAHAMPEADQVELVDAHPRLGAPPATVSALSFREQGYDREPDDGEEAERRLLGAQLDDLNARYEARFGFRYCVFVAGRPRAALIPEMAAALERNRDAELHRALDAVVDIARDRWSRAAREGDAGPSA